MDNREITREELIAEIARLEALFEAFEGEPELYLERCHEFAELLPAVVFETNTKGVLTFVNKRATEVTGYSTEELLGGLRSIDFLVPEDRERAAANLRLRMTGGVSGESDYVAVRKNGTRYDVAVYSKPIMRDGVPVGLRGFALNVTTHRHTEKAALSHEARFDAFIEQTTDAVWCFVPAEPISTELSIEEQLELMRDLRIVECNANCAKAYGYSEPAEVTGKKITELIDLRDDSHIPLFVEFISGDYRVENSETKEILPDGSVKYYLNNVKGVLEGDYLVRLWGSFRDVTEQKRAEDLVRVQRDLGLALGTATELAEVLSLCTDAALDASDMDVGGVYLVDAETGDVDLAFQKGISDEAVARISHYDGGSTQSAAALSGKPRYDRYSTRGRQNIRGLRELENLKTYGLIPAIHERKVVACLSVAGNKFDEVPRYAKDALEAIAAQAAAVIARLGVERALAESEERYRNLVENAADIVYRYNLVNEQYEYISPAVENVLGYTPGEFRDVVRGGYRDKLHNEDIELHLERREARLSGKSPEEWFVPEIEYRLPHRDGQYLWILDNRRLITDSSGKPVAVEGIVRDISARKIAEEALQRSEKRFRDMAEMLPEIIFELDLEGNFTFVNENAFRTTGYPDDAIQSGLNVVEVLVPQDRERAMANIREVLEKGYIIPREYSILRKDGTVFPATVHAAPIIRDGEPVGLRGIVIDISERKKAVDALCRSEERYRHLVGNMAEGLANVDENEVFVFANPAAERFFGIESGTLVGRRVTEFLDEDGIAVIEKQTKARRKGETSVYELDIVRPDGELRQMVLTASPSFDAGGNFIGTIGIIRDVTERKRAEDAIAIERDRARRYLDIAGVILVGLDLDGSVNLLNRKGCDILGRAEDEVIGRNWFDVALPEKIRTEVKGVFARIKAGDIAPVEYYENLVVSRDGEERLIGWHNSVIRDDEGRITGVLCSGEDITERK